LTTKKGFYDLTVNIWSDAGRREKDFILRPLNSNDDFVVVYN